MKQLDLTKLCIEINSFSFILHHDHISIRKSDGSIPIMWYDFIESAYCDFSYNTELVLNKVEAFLGGKVTDVLSTHIAQIDRSRGQSLERDWLFILVKEDETIEGTFAHCNYKMVWSDINDFISWMDRGDRERDNLLDEEEHNRICEIEEGVE